LFLVVVDVAAINLKSGNAFRILILILIANQPTGRYFSQINATSAKKDRGSEFEKTFEQAICRMNPLTHTEAKKRYDTTMILSSVFTITPSVGRRLSQSTLTCLFVIVWSVCGASGFISSSIRQSHAQTQNTWCRIRIPTILAQNSDDQAETTGIPQLPAIGASSLGSFQDLPSVDGDQFVPTQVVSAKFELQYTCNVCETRNSHRVSRVACE
jgi:hypothetical protein